MKNKKLVVIISIVLLLMVSIGGVVYYQTNANKNKAKKASYNNLSIILTMNEVDIEVFSEFYIDDFIESYEGSLYTENDINTEILGNYEITYTVSDDYNQSKQEVLIVNVVDTTKPTLELTTTNIEVEVGTELDLKSYIKSVSDNYDDLSVNDVFIENQANINVVSRYDIIYSVSDTSNNSNTLTLTVSVIDKKVASNTNTPDNNTSNNNSNNNQNNNSGSTTDNNSNNNQSNNDNTTPTAPTPEPPTVALVETKCGTITTYSKESIRQTAIGNSGWVCDSEEQAKAEARKVLTDSNSVWYGSGRYIPAVLSYSDGSRMWTVTFE